MYVELHKNERELIVYDYDDEAKKKKKQSQKISIKEVTHIAVGQNCKHHHL